MKYEVTVKLPRLEVTEIVDCKDHKTGWDGYPYDKRSAGFLVANKLLGSVGTDHCIIELKEIKENG